METFQFSKVYDNEPKHGKCYNERSLSMAFEVKMRKITGKFSMKFYKLTFLWLNNQII